MHWSASDFQLVTVNGAPGLLMRHPIAGTGTYSFDIVDGRIRAIYVVRTPTSCAGSSSTRIERGKGMAIMVSPPSLR